MSLCGAVNIHTPHAASKRARPQAPQEVREGGGDEGTTSFQPVAVQPLALK